jgi:hypothetical protein
VVLAAAGAFALHDKAGGVDATSIAFVLRRIGLVLDRALDSGVTLPSLAFNEVEVGRGNVANQLAVALVNALKLLFACEVLHVCHFRRSNQFVIEHITVPAYSVNNRGRLLLKKENALTNLAGTVIQKRMGRPPLNVKETKVRLPLETRDRIEALVGANRMAAFIREAVENELKRREKVAKSDE